MYNHIKVILYSLSIICLFGCNYSKEEKLWTQLNSVPGLDGNNFRNHNIFRTDRGTLIATGYYPIENVDCGLDDPIIPLFTCVKFRIFRSTDGGKSWKSIPDQPINSDGALIKGDVYDYFVSRRRQSLFSKIFRGIIYSDQFKPNIIHENSEEILMYIDPGIFRSVDDGITWQKIVSENEDIRFIYDASSRLFLGAYFFFKDDKSLTNRYAYLRDNKTQLFAEVEGNVWDESAVYYKSGSGLSIFPKKILESNLYYKLNGVYQKKEVTASHGKVHVIVNTGYGIYAVVDEDDKTRNLQDHERRKSLIYYGYNDDLEMLVPVHLESGIKNDIVDLNIIDVYNQYIFIRANVPIRKNWEASHVLYYILDTDKMKMVPMVFPELYEFSYDDKVKLHVDNKSGIIYLATLSKIYRSHRNYLDLVFKRYDDSPVVIYDKNTTPVNSN